MTRTIALALAGCMSLALLQGCAGVVVGGAATGAAVAHDRRTAGTVLEDQSIEFKILGALFADKELYNQSHINATSYNAIVLLTGEAPSEALRARMEEHARNVDKVRRVENAIVVAAPSSMMSRGSDTVITGKVKTSLFKVKGYDGFDPTRVKVVTEAGVVYLMGLLTRGEGDAVAETASQIGGVQRVVKVFEYAD